MIEAKQLRIFKAIAEIGTFTGAGEHLGMSQPAISQQMHVLERMVGVALLSRVGRGARPTPAGELLLHCARHVLGKLEEVERRLAEHGAELVGVARIGAPEPACNHLLPSLLVELKREFPRVELRVISGHTVMTMQRLAAGALDLALLPLPIDEGRLRVTEAGRDELVAIAAPEHPWVRRRYVTARDFESEPVILYDRHSHITERMLAFLLEEGVFPRIAVEIDHLEAIKDLVRAGVGVTVVPRWSVRREVTAGALSAVRLGEHGLACSWGLIHEDTGPQSRTLRALVRRLSEGLPPRLGHEV